MDLPVLVSVLGVLLGLGLAWQFPRIRVWAVFAAGVFGAFLLGRRAVPGPPPRGGGGVALDLGAKRAADEERRIRRAAKTGELAEQVNAERRR